VSGHHHAHDGAGRRGKLIVVFAITFIVTIAEIIGSVLTGSLALLADAGHMFTNSAGLLIALIAASLALKPATLKRTWGYQRAEIVAAAGQAALLLASAASSSSKVSAGSSNPLKSPEPRCSGSGSSAWPSSPPAGSTTST
jgi:Co/Zn/Cd efflux system component